MLDVHLAETALGASPSGDERVRERWQQDCALGNGWWCEHTRTEFEVLKEQVTERWQSARTQSAQRPAE